MPKFVVQKRVEHFDDIYFLQVTVYRKFGFFKFQVEQKSSSSPSYYGSAVAEERVERLAAETEEFAVSRYR